MTTSVVEVLRSALRWPSVHAAASGTTALVLLSVIGSLTAARAGSPGGDLGMPRDFSVPVCYQLVQETGRMIAWARWEAGAAEDEVLLQFGERTPQWIVVLTDQWIEDAYHWEVTDDQVRQWATELGNTSVLSRADELTTPQTIAIWLRRIARQCIEQRA